MLVYGDHRELAEPRERLDAIRRRLPQIGAMPPGIRRHAKLVGALIDAGQLLQSVADKVCPPQQLDAFIYRLAQCVVQSWDSGFTEIGEVPEVPTLQLSRTVELRVPEG